MISSVIKLFSACNYRDLSACNFVASLITFTIGFIVPVHKHAVLCECCMTFVLRKQFFRVFMPVVYLLDRQFLSDLRNAVGWPLY
jgi:hypothetical protein